ncbi:proteoglycan 4-like [Arachis ipaensis]|nr:proteoglycan 4-like [Arachis ipaensis]
MFHISSIPSQEYWEHHEGLSCLPPPYKRPIGRPTKNRRKDSTEQSSGSQYKAKRRYGQITCQTCKRTRHNSRICPDKRTGTAAKEPDLDEEEAREQEANWEETMEAAHAAHVADEEDLTQNHPQRQPDQNNINDGNTTTNALPLNVATIPAATNLVGPTATSEPAPAPKRRGRPSFVRDNPVPPRERGSTTRTGLAATTTPPTPAQNAAAAPLPPAQPRVVRPDVGSRSQISASPSNVGSLPQGPLLRPTLQAQHTAPFRPPTVTRETMAAASPATQSRFTGFMPTPSLKKKKPSGPPPSKPSTNDKK